MKQWIQEKKRWIVSILIFSILLVIGMFNLLSPLDKHGHTPQSTIVRYEQAIEEQDGLTIRKVATDEQAKKVADMQEIDLFQPKQRNRGQLGYLMKEFRMDRQEYWYKVRWNRQNGSPWFKFYRVHYSEERGWRVEEIRYEEIKAFTDEMIPETIRENPHD